MRKVKYELFESDTKSWDTLCADAAAFATSVGHENLINISVSAAGGTHFGGAFSKGTIFVWYWGS